MTSFVRNRITLVWLGLVLATSLSWETFTVAGDIRNLGAVVLVIAFIKVRYIMLEFMELRHAPLVMRLFAEGWAVLVCAAVVILTNRHACVAEPRSGYALPALGNTRINWPGFTPPNGRPLRRR